MIFIHNLFQCYQTCFFSLGRIICQRNVTLWHWWLCLWQKARGVHCSDLCRKFSLDGCEVSVGKMFTGCESFTEVCRIALINVFPFFLTFSEFVVYIFLTGRSYLGRKWTLFSVSVTVRIKSHEIKLNPTIKHKISKKNEVLQLISLNKKGWSLLHWVFLRTG